MPGAPKVIFSVGGDDATDRIILGYRIVSFPRVSFFHSDVRPRILWVMEFIMPGKNLSILHKRNVYLIVNVR